MSNNLPKVPIGNVSPGNFSSTDTEDGVPNRQAMLDKVFKPAIALMVTGALDVVIALWLLFDWVFAFTKSEIATQAAKQAQASQTVMLDISQILAIFGIVLLFVGVLIVSGARKMKNLKCYRTAMTASILAIIPFFSGCCSMGLATGTWSVVVLMNNDVKQSFS
jgi:hypothetical protein